MRGARGDLGGPLVPWVQEVRPDQALQESQGVQPLLCLPLVQWHQDDPSLQNLPFLPLVRGVQRGRPAQAARVDQADPGPHLCPEVQTPQSSEQCRSWSQEDQGGRGGQEVQGGP